MSTRDAHRRVVVILGYHKIGRPSCSGWETWYHVPESTLAAHLGELRGGGWEFIDLTRLLAGLEDPTTLPARSALVTFDDGYGSLVSCALPVLVEADCPAVAFVPTDYIGKASDFDAGTSEPTEPICDWDDLRELQHNRVSVQSHGASHVAFSTLEPSHIADELSTSRATLEAGLGTSVQSLAYPYGDHGIDPRATERALRRTGYRVAFSYGGGPIEVSTADRMRIPRVAVGPDTMLADVLAAGLEPCD